MPNAKTIAFYLATRNSSPFFVRKHVAVVPNVSWGLLAWEADLLILTKSGYLNEVEIKISMADWKADFDKAKFSDDPNRSTNLWKSQQMIRRMYYAAPMVLAERYTELPIPDYAGVIGMTDQGRATILKHAKTRKDSRQLTTEERLTLLRLAAIKAWRMAYNPALDTIDWAARFEEPNDA